ncbi:MKRN2 opposite strand protein-like [Eucyclogobius newberryi]|uniref:MKRN2 opposite strand protein-like n=1 Tax=Eucyclogobius newberryi TaxID=166745 RepID=UPI003B5A0C6F
MERSIIRLVHYRRQIFCFSVPDTCPCCGEELKGARLTDAPVSLPRPLSNAHKSRCSLVIAPAESNANREFDGAADLHTGISNTKGLVYNYTSGGVRRDPEGWEEAVVVPLVRPDMFHLLDRWDQYLERFCQNSSWDPLWTRFDDQTHNCFSFCLDFVNLVLELLGQSRQTRESFIQSHILPQMKRLWKHSAIYRRLEREGSYALDPPEDQDQD